MSIRVVVSIIGEMEREGGGVLLDPWFGSHLLLMFEWIIHSDIGVFYGMFFS